VLLNIKKKNGEKMNKKMINRIMLNKKFGVLLILAIFVASGMVYANSGSNAINIAGKNISCALCKISQLIFMIVGSVAALVIIMAGLRWVTSGDDPGARQGAKTTIISAFVGIIIVVIAVFIVSVVLQGVMGVDYIDPASWIGGCVCEGKGQPIT
jgi:hypothetical protein